MNVSPEQATSMVSFYDSMMGKMRRIIDQAEATGETEERKYRRSTIPKRHLKTDAQKIAMVKDVLQIVNNGESWRSAVAQRGQGYEASSVIRLAKVYGLYTPSKSHKGFAKDRKKADLQYPIIEARRKSGLTVIEAIEGTGISADQYYRARERCKRLGSGRKTTNN